MLAAKIRLHLLQHSSVLVTFYKALHTDRHYAWLHCVEQCGRVYSFTTCDVRTAEKVENAQLLQFPYVSIFGKVPPAKAPVIITGNA